MMEAPEQFLSVLFTKFKTYTSKDISHSFNKFSSRNFGQQRKSAYF